MKNFKPLYDNMLVELDTAEKKTETGIIISIENEHNSTRNGKVIAVGEGRLNSDGTTSKLLLNVGDNVVFGQHSGISIQFDGKDYLMLREPEIFGVIK